MRRSVVLAAGAGAAAAVAGAAVGVARSRGAPGEGWQERLMLASAGLPTGPLGWVSARMMGVGHRPVYATMAGALDLQPDDDLLDVGCGSAGLLRHHAVHLRHVAGLDASEIQVEMSRRRLRDRIAAGTAEIVMGDATALPWEDGRFSAVTAYGCIEFVPDPQKALSEMHRVLRPGGRAVVTLGLPVEDASLSGTKNDWGIRRWSEADARRLMEEAGFGDVSISIPPTPRDFFFQLVRGVKQAQAPVIEPAGLAAPTQEARR